MDFLLLGMLGLLGCLYFYIGLRASSRVTTATDYYLANRSLGFWQVTCNLIATQLGGGLLLGTAQEAYTKGWYGLLYSLGMGIGFLILALGVAGRLQRSNVSTTAQLLEVGYNSALLKQIASLLSIITLFGILVAQCTGFKQLMCSIGFSPLPGMIFWLSVIGYTMLGGLRAITINDMVQLGIIVVVFGGLFVVSLVTDPATALATLSVGGQGLSWSELVPVILMPALFSLMTQDLVQRFFAARSVAVATSSALAAGIFIFSFAAIPVYFGLLAKLGGIELGAANPLLVYLAQHTNRFVFAWVVCAVVAAIISTADALTNAISANITQDFTIRWKNISGLAMAKIVSGIVGVGALMASFYVPNSIITIMIESYALSVTALLVPLLYVFFDGKRTTRAGLVSTLVGLGSFLLFSWWPTPVPKELLALGLSWAGFVVAKVAV